MKKILWPAVCGLMLSLWLNAPAQAANGNFGGGNGSATNPYTIEDAADLNAVRNNLGANYALANDIDLSAYLAPGGDGFALWNTAGWLPLGNDSTHLGGNFDGAGHKITGLWINRPTTDYVGLFGYADGTLSNLGVEIDAAGVTGRDYVGALAGFKDNSNSVVDSYATGNINGVNNVGGLVGEQSNGNNIITGSYAIVNVTGGDNVGGLVGYQDNSTTILGCFARGSVSGANNVGGLVGYQRNSTSVYDSFATASVTGSGQNIGGLVGYKNNGGYINYSFASGNVSGGSNAGGLVGYQGNGSHVWDSYATGNVTGDDSVGGLAGQQSGGGSDIFRGYATGNVTGNTNVGGLLGSQSGSIANCFFNTDTSGQPPANGVGNITNAPGVTGKTTVEMQTRSTFTSVWNFSTLWTMQPPDGTDYPRLAWQTLNVTLTGGPWYFTGSPIEPTVDQVTWIAQVTPIPTTITHTLADTVDYSVIYSNNTNAGINTATVTARGEGDWDGFWGNIDFTIALQNGGGGGAPTAVPTLGQWALALLALMLAGAGAGQFFLRLHGQARR